MKAIMKEIRLILLIILAIGLFILILDYFGIIQHCDGRYVFGTTLNKTISDEESAYIALIGVINATSRNMSDIGPDILYKRIEIIDAEGYTKKINAYILKDTKHYAIDSDGRIYAVLSCR